MDLNGTPSSQVWNAGASALAPPGPLSPPAPQVPAWRIQQSIGFAIRHRRRLIDMTLRELADACGVSFQQIHKYEAGLCSVSAVQLWRIGSALGVPVTYFFERLKAMGPG
ncbi:MAG: putative transcriptional regulator [Phenylobacterium sp.]|nr:putative transcriptional regulator [Phenylobacterium sp.]MDB5434316.1 putative transcriptional regulator [Phenylobacterium sp.]